MVFAHNKDSAILVLFFLSVSPELAINRQSPENIERWLSYGSFALLLLKHFISKLLFGGFVCLLLLFWRGVKVG